MADTKILNLDEFIAEQPARQIIWRGQEHPVAGLTGLAYLKFLQAKGALDRAMEKKDEAAQWEQNLVIVGLLVPSLAALRDELLALKLGALNKLVGFIMAEMSEETPTGEAGVDAAPGESTSPV
jgi:hypothetical protein